MKTMKIDISDRAAFLENWKIINKIGQQDLVMKLYDRARELLDVNVKLKKLLKSIGWGLEAT